MTTTIVEKLRKQIESFETTVETEGVGTVVSVGDGVAEIDGLPTALMAEMVEFDTTTGVELADAIEFAQKLLHPDVAVVCTPGPWIAEECADGTRPGEGYVRFSLVPSVEDTRRACDAIVKHLT